MNFVSTLGFPTLSRLTVVATNIDDNGLFLGNNPMDLEPAIKNLSKVLDREFSEQSILNSGAF